MENSEYKRGSGRVWGGLFLLAIGCVLLMKQLGFFFPFWFFRWPMFMIVLGLFIGLRHGFRGPSWAILMLIGGIFLFDIVEPGYSVQKFTAPILIIGFGLFMIVRPRHRRVNGQWGNDWRRDWQQHVQPHQPQASEARSFNENDAVKPDYIDSVSVFGSTRKVIVSKNFKGGDLVAIFGGNEIDLRQAEISGETVLDVTQIFGGTKIILPAHWDIKFEMVAFFGGIEDKRQIATGTVHTEKVLILKGTSIFGGIDIRNY